MASLDLVLAQLHPRLRHLLVALVDDVPHRGVGEDLLHEARHDLELVAGAHLVDGARGQGLADLRLLHPEGHAGVVGEAVTEV